MTVYIKYKNSKNEYDKEEKFVDRVETNGTHIHVVYEHGVWGLVSGVTYNKDEVEVVKVLSK